MVSKKEELVKVKALQTGYYGEERRYAGEEFVMKAKDFFVMKDGQKVTETVEDEETGEMYEAYKTCTWVDLIEENYNPESDVVKAPTKKKVRIGPVPAKGLEAPEPLTGKQTQPEQTVRQQAFHQPSNPNPQGFAAGPAPAKATDDNVHKADPTAPKPQPVKVNKDDKPADKAAEKKTSDDVI